ncbi:MAG TPA: phosphohydrolase, partial [Clostridiales bacterium]|nr:phosphohydrolase [Clostridiales bacterium]
NEEYYKKGSNTSISHFYDKLLRLKELMNTQTAKKLAENRQKYMEQFLEEFYAEWNGRK